MVAVSCRVPPIAIDALGGEIVIDLTLALLCLAATTVRPFVTDDDGALGGSVHVAIATTVNPSASETAIGLRRMLFLQTGLLRLS